MPTTRKSLKGFTLPQIRTIEDADRAIELLLARLDEEHRRHRNDIAALETTAADHETRITALEGP